MPGFFVVDQRWGVCWLAGAGMTVSAGARKVRHLDIRNVHHGLRLLKNARMPSQ